MSKRNNKGIGSNCNSNKIFHVNMNKECVVMKVASMLSTHCSM